MRDYLVNIHADGGWKFHTEVRASSESEALSEVVTMLNGKWIDLKDSGGKLNRLRTDRIINLAVTDITQK